MQNSTISRDWQALMGEFHRRRDAGHAMGCADKLAAQEKIPYILFLDGAGYRASNALERHPYAPSDLLELAALSGQVAHGCGGTGRLGRSRCAHRPDDGFSGYAGRRRHFFRRATSGGGTGEHLDKQQLGGAGMHAAVSGVCHNVVANEQEAYDEIIDPRELRNVIIKGLDGNASRPGPAGPIGGSGVRP